MINNNRNPVNWPFQSPEGIAIWFFFSHDGTRLYSGGISPKVWIWDVERRELCGEIDSGNEHVLSASLHSSKDWLAGTCGDHLCVWDMQTYQEILRTESQVSPLWNVHFCETVLACSRRDRKIRLFDANSGKKVGRLQPVVTPIHGVSATPDGQRLGAIHYSGTHVWDRVGNELLYFPGYYTHGGASQSDITFRQNGQQVWVTFRGGPHLRVWNLETTPPQLLLETDLGGPAYHLAFSRDEQLVAVSLWREVVVLHSESFEILDRWEIPPQLHPGNGVGMICFSPDHRLLGTVQEDLYEDRDKLLWHRGGISLWPVKI